jgi:hypothetical protein
VIIACESVSSGANLLCGPSNRKCTVLYSKQTSHLLRHRNTKVKNMCKKLILIIFQYSKYFKISSKFYLKISSSSSKAKPPGRSDGPFLLYSVHCTGDNMRMTFIFFSLAKFLEKKCLFRTLIKSKSINSFDCSNLVDDAWITGLKFTNFGRTNFSPIFETQPPNYRMIGIIL